MTLMQLIDANVGLFYGQTWYRNETFAHASLDIDGMALSPPTGFEPCHWAREFGEKHALLLAACYVQHPNHDVFRNYLWTSDSDKDGQVVYVGGTANGHGFEIHRHIHLTDRFGHAEWA